MDWIAAPLGAGIASLRTGHRVVLSEGNSHLCSFAAGRLIIFGTTIRA